MCLNKVELVNIKRVRREVNYFPCGRCPSCRQALANKRSQKISCHEQKDSICYFVTLHYYNKCIPYVSRKELRSIVEHGRESGINDFCVPVYRDTELSRVQRDYVIKDKKVKIGDLNFSFPDILRDLVNYKPLSNGNIDGILGIRTKISKDNYYYDPDKISVAFTPDAQKFIKRLRHCLEDYDEKFRKISYFYAPEYGPTSHRFHIHFLLWFDYHISPTEVRSLILKAWKFCDKSRLEKYVEVARNPSSYVSSYVNRPADTPFSLYALSPLKTSHSLFFGFNSKSFSFKKVFENFLRSRTVTFKTVVLDKGVPVERDLPYPKYLQNRYFPKIKGFNRLSFDSLKRFYLSAFKLCSKNESNSKPVCYSSSTLEPIFQSNLVDVYGRPICFSVSQYNYEVKRIQRYFKMVRKYFGNRFSFERAFDVLYQFHIAYNSFLYKSMFNNQLNPLFDCTLVYYNLESVLLGNINAPTINLNRVYDDKFIYCHNIPFDFEREKELLNKFDKHIKQRKFNQF